MQLECINCGDPVAIHATRSGFVSDGCFAIDIPGVICSDECLDDLIDKMADLPQLACTEELTLSNAFDAILAMDFLENICEAMDFFIQFFPANAQILDAAAVRLHGAGEIRRAFDLLEAGIKNCDDPDRLRLELATFVGMEGAPSMALNMLSEVSPDTERFHTIKGNLLRATGDWAKAAVSWKTAIEKDPEDDVAWFNLGCYLIQIKKDYKSALEHYEKACRHFPQERRFRAYVGDALFFTGDKTAAYEQYQQALQLSGGDENFEASLLKMIETCDK